MVPVSFAPLRLAGADFVALRCGALFWPAQQALLIADLHLEKSSFFARFGQYLPPFDSIATLDRLDEAIRATEARMVICLGDNFHDSAGEARLAGDAAATLARLCGRRDWVWITGNHDPDVSGACGGRVVRELDLAGIRLTHQASRRDGAEISGHFHPRLILRLRGRRVARPCFVRGSAPGRARLILPSYGVLTGGMDAGDPVIRDAAGGGQVEALVPVGDRLLRYPLGQPIAAATRAAARISP